MTVQATTARADYDGNGVTTVFSTQFVFIQNSHIKVLLTNKTTGVSTTLTLGSDYTVTGAGTGAAGFVTMTVAPAAGYRLSILRNVPLTQLVHYPTNGPFPAATHELALDQLTMAVQQAFETIGRSLALPAAAVGISTSLPYPIANNVLGWDAAAQTIVNIDPSSILTIAGSSGFAKQTLSGDGTTTAFPLSANPGSTANMDVSVGGVQQRGDIDFTLVGNTLTFTTPPPSGTNNIYVRWGQTLGIGVPSDGSVTAAKLASGAAASNLGAGGVTASMLASGAATLAKLDQTGASGYVLTGSGPGAPPLWAALPGMFASAVNAINANAVLAANAVGTTTVVYGSSSVALTLPSAAVVAAGKRIEIISIATATATVSRAGADLIVGNSNSTTSVSLGNGDTLTLESNGTNTWYTVAGTAAFQFSAVMKAASNMAAPGYRAFPAYPGDPAPLILQWGGGTTSAGVQSIVFPTAFPTAIFGAFAIAAQTGNYVMQVNSQSTSGATFAACLGSNGAAVATNFNWIALGK